MRKKTHKRHSEVEPFSMVSRHSVGAADIRHEDGETMPVVNVKVRPLHRHLPPDLRDVSESVSEGAYESVQQQWWEDTAPYLADQCLRAAFKGMQPEVRQYGRSGGWLAVAGIGAPDVWTARQMKAWARFEREIKTSMGVAEALFHDEIRERM